MFIGYVIAINEDAKSVFCVFAQPPSLSSVLSTTTKVYSVCLFKKTEGLVDPFIVQLDRCQDECQVAEALPHLEVAPCSVWSRKPPHGSSDLSIFDREPASWESPTRKPLLFMREMVHIPRFGVDKPRRYWLLFLPRFEHDKLVRCSPS